MLIYYLSDGGYSRLMTLDDLLENLHSSYSGISKESLEEEIGYPTLYALCADICEALDMDGFWHGLLTYYNVCVIRKDVIEKIECEPENNS